MKLSSRLVIVIIAEARRRERRRECQVQRRLQRTEEAAAADREKERNKERDRYRDRDRSRSSLNEDQREALRARKREEYRRRRSRSSLDSVVGRQSLEILEGKVEVEDLAATADSIGTMTHHCPHCGALKFKGESKGSCCGDGKVSLPLFPRPSPEIMELLLDNNQDGKIFRKNARYINNAVSLTSVAMKEERQVGFNPSVIINGQVYHRAGPLLPNDGEVPRYAQLYVNDPNLETNRRFENMVLPDTTTGPQREVLRRLLRQVQTALHRDNPFVKDFKQILELPQEEFETKKLVISAVQPRGEHARRYNQQINLHEVSIVTNTEKYDLVVHLKGGGLQYVSDMNPKSMPLHFTLLFPYGTPGWDQYTLHADGKGRRTTAREFFAYHLQVRMGDNCNYLHRTGRLFQEWICLAWLNVETQRLNYQRNNQKALRADSYKSIKEAAEERFRQLEPRADQVYPDDHQRPVVGRVILSSSYTGSPRWYNAKFQDAMAIVRAYHKPDLFITMTCNPQWTEITSELEEGQLPQDRPDIVARVFKLKKDQLIHDLVKEGVLGKVVAYMYTIEFQKRGLPHCHILLILKEEDRALTPEVVDKMVVAELPPSPDDTDDPEEKARREKLGTIVLNNMIHGPCGAGSPRPCMKDGRCEKNFPKTFVEETIVDRDNFYATYRRRSPESGGRELRHLNGKMINNSWVVPYSPFLSLR